MGNCCGKAEEDVNKASMVKKKPTETVEAKEPGADTGPDIVKEYQLSNIWDYYQQIRLLGEGDRIINNAYKYNEKSAADVIRAVLLALKHCHEQDIVHRDLKPENFVFKTPDPDSDGILIDFGCARYVKDEEVYTDLVGTPFYLAPESADQSIESRSGKTLKASDMWSVGVLTYVIVTGRPPFYGKTNADIFRSILSGKYKFYDWMKLSDECKDFIAKLLVLKPEDRMNVQQALKHPWIYDETIAGTEDFADEFRDNMNKFVTQTRLKKALAQKLMSELSEAQLAEFEKLFNEMDADKNGHIDKDELIEMFKRSKWGEESACIEEADRVMKMADTDKNGVITLKEFSVAQINNLLSLEKEIYHLFNRIDKDGDGYIELSELKDMFKEQETVDQVRKILEEVDKNGDGKLSPEEFHEALSGAMQQGIPANKLQDAPKV